MTSARKQKTPNISGPTGAKNITITSANKPNIATDCDRMIGAMMPKRIVETLRGIRTSVAVTVGSAISTELCVVEKL